MVNWQLAVAATSTSAATSLDLVQNKVGLKSYFKQIIFLQSPVWWVTLTKAGNWQNCQKVNW